MNHIHKLSLYFESMVKNVLTGGEYMRVLFMLIMLIPFMIQGIVVPFSNELIKTETNHTGQMVKTSPPDQAVANLKTDTWFWHDGKNLYIYWEVEIDDNFRILLV